MLNKIFTPQLISIAVLIGIYLLIYIVIRMYVPPPNEFIIQIKSFYKDYGYPLVLIGALLEGNFLVGIYVPGSTIVLLGAALSRTGVVSFPIILFLGTFGLVSSYVFNYIIGRYGWYHALSLLGFDKGIQVGKEKLEQHGIKALLVGYFFPGSAAFMSTAAGILKMPFKQFLLYSIVSQTFWSIFWGGIAYTFGLRIVEFILKNFIFLLLIIGVIWLGKRIWNKL